MRKTMGATSGLGKHVVYMPKNQTMNAKKKAPQSHIYKHSGSLVISLKKLF